MAKNPELLNRVLSVCMSAIERTYKNKAKPQGAKEFGAGAVPHPGAITYVQRFGGAINLNIHFHILFLEGVYVEKDGGVEFCEVAISHEDVEATIRRIQSRVIRLLCRRGLLSESEDEASQTQVESDTDQSSIIDACQGASAQSLIAMGERAGQSVRRVGSFGGPGEPIVPEGLRCVRVGGFSLHANVEIEARERGKLEKLCRYLARPPVAESRLERTADGQVLYHMKSEWRDGTRAILLSPMEFIEKLVAIIPPPRRHLARFHGVLAPNSRLREKVVPKSAAEVVIAENSKPPMVESPLAKQKRLKWAELLKRIFQIDVTKCPDCTSGEVRLIAVIEDPKVIRKILEHVGFGSSLPRRQTVYHAAEPDDWLQTTPDPGWD
jgi:hypothetical protein